jgi:hypothetical protein
MIEKESLEQFKKLYFENYGIELNNDEALEIGLQLINLTKIALGISLDD